MALHKFIKLTNNPVGNISWLQSIISIQDRRSTRIFNQGSNNTPNVSPNTVQIEARRQLSSSQFMAEPITNLKKLVATENDIRTQMEILIMKTQADVCHALENEENFDQKFKIDRWDNNENGGGITCVLQDGDVFEKANVDISVVNRIHPLSNIKEMRFGGKYLATIEQLPFFATGISGVIYPRNPMIPTIQFNYKYFEAENQNGENNWWFVGGTDLCPHYVNANDCIHFHKILKQTCDDHDVKYYPKFKKWCDEYFRIRQRNESRGVGGIFFNDLDTPNQNDVFRFVQSCANAIVPSYLPLVQKHKNDCYGDRERQWQLIRRGRLVEFNLMYDPATKFGLNTPGASRYENILISLPLNARFEYKNVPQPGTKEAQLLEVLQNPRDWHNL